MSEIKITPNDVLQQILAHGNHNVITDMLCQLNDEDARIHTRYHFLLHARTQKTMEEFNQLRLQHLDIRRRINNCRMEIGVLVDYEMANANERVLNILNDIACRRR